MAWGPAVVWRGVWPAARGVPCPYGARAVLRRQKSLSNSDGRQSFDSVFNTCVPTEHFRGLVSLLSSSTRRPSTPRPNERRGQDNEGCNAPGCQPARPSSHDVRPSVRVRRKTFFLLVFRIMKDERARNRDKSGGRLGWNRRITWFQGHF